MSTLEERNPGLAVGGRSFPESAASTRIPTTSARTFRRRAILTILVLASVFGPYLVSGVRTEQVVLYALATGALLAGAGSGWRIPHRVIWWILAWVAMLCVYLLSTILANREVSMFRVLAFADRHILPIAAVLSGLWFIRRLDLEAQRRIWTLALWSIVLLVTLNGLIATLQSVGYLHGFVDPFLPEPTARGTVSSRAMSGGRYGGIFNQPFEAGIGYTIGLLAMLALLPTVSGWARVGLWLAGALLFVGGLVSGSKAFFPLGVVVATATVAPDVMRRGRRTGLGVLVGLFVIGVVTGARLGMDRIGRFLRAFGDDASLLRVYTGGRFGAGGLQSSLREGIGDVLSRSPFLGNGLGSSQTPIDIGLLEVLYQGGVFGVLVWSLTIVLMALIIRRIHVDEQRKTVMVIFVFLLLASVGGPSFTADRAATLFWILWGLSLGTTAPGPVLTARNA